MYSSKLKLYTTMFLHVLTGTVENFHEISYTNNFRNFYNKQTLIAAMLLRCGFFLGGGCGGLTRGAPGTNLKQNTLH